MSVNHFGFLAVPAKILENIDKHGEFPDYFLSCKISLFVQMSILQAFAG